MKLFRILILNNTYCWLLPKKVWNDGLQNSLLNKVVVFQSQCTVAEQLNLLEQLFLEEVWMDISVLSAVSKASDVNALEASEFMCCKVTKIQSFSDVTIKIFFRWLFPNACLLWIKKAFLHLVKWEKFGFDRNKYLEKCDILRKNPRISWYPKKVTIWNFHRVFFLCKEIFWFFFLYPETYLEAKNEMNHWIR